RHDFSCPGCRDRLGLVRGGFQFGDEFEPLGRHRLDPAKAASDRLPRPVRAAVTWEVTDELPDDVGRLRLEGEVEADRRLAGPRRGDVEGVAAEIIPP